MLLTVKPLQGKECSVQVTNVLHRVIELNLVKAGKQLANQMLASLSGCVSWPHVSFVAKQIDRFVSL